MGASLQEISGGVSALLGPVPASSVRSYLQLNTPEVYSRLHRGQYALAGFETPEVHVERETRDERRAWSSRDARLIHSDCLHWLESQAPNPIHAVVTDPPCGLVEYSDEEQRKPRSGRGGVWQTPPRFDGATRAPLPRFTVLKPPDLLAL